MSALLAQSTNSAEIAQSGLLLAPLALPLLSLALPSSHLQYAPQYLQSAPRVASTVVVPAALQQGTTSALFASAPLHFKAAAVQPASQVGTPLSMGAHPSQAGAPLSMGANPFQVGAQFEGAQPSQAAAPFVAQFGAPCVVNAQLATPVDAQPKALAADWDKKDSNALLKLASRPRFCESAGNKIRGFVADFELYLRMCARPVHHWGYFLMASLGAEEAEKVRRSHLADVIADYAKFKSGVEELFGTFEFEGSFRAQLRTHAQSGAESIAAYAARTTDMCSKAYPAFATETAFARCGPLHRGAG